MVRDAPSSIEQIRRLLNAFDVPPEEIRFDIRVVQAGPKRAVISPPSAEVALDEELAARLRGLLRYEDFRVLAQAALTSRAGEQVEYALGDDYDVAFRLVSVVEGRRVKLEGFRVVRRPPRAVDKSRQLPPQQLFQATLNLWLDKPFTLVLDAGRSQEGSVDDRHFVPAGKDALSARAARVEGARGAFQVEFVCKYGTADGRVLTEVQRGADIVSVRRELERQGCYVFEVKARSGFNLRGLPAAPQAAHVDGELPGLQPGDRRPAARRPAAPPGARPDARADGRPHHAQRAQRDPRPGALGRRAVGRLRQLRRPLPRSTPRASRPANARASSSR